VLGAAVGVDRQRERRPRRRRGDLEVWLPFDAARRGRPGAPTRGLLEANPVRSDLRLRLQRRVRDRRDRELARAELHPRDSDVPAAEVAVVDDRTCVVHLDERA